MGLVKNIRHSAILVDNLAQATWFYGELLGYKIHSNERLSKEYSEKLFPGLGLDLTYMKLVLDNKDMIELYYLHNKKKLPVKTLEHIAMTVESVDKLYALFQKNGVYCLAKPVLDEIGKHKLFFAVDPAENLLEFVEELSPMPPKGSLL